MEYIYPGTVFSDSVRMDDGSSMSKPYIVLYNRASKHWFTADTYTPDTATSTDYTFVFSATTTQKMPAGVYDLEIYSDSNKTNLVDRFEAFAKTVAVAATNGSVSPSGEESSEE